MIENSISAFDPISLQGMDSVALLNRIDTKYLIDISTLCSLLDENRADYQVLEIDAKRFTTYDTLYFDYSNAELYMKHHNQHGARYKVRHRTYRESNLGFLELKFKTNKGRTIKKRIKDSLDIGFTTELQANFLQRNLGEQYKQLQPKINITYKRITLVSKHKAERVTIDLDLGFHFNDAPTVFNNLVVIEVKQDNKASSAIVNAIMQKHIREFSMSKYCIAMALKYPHLKHNNFKPILNKIKQLNNYK